MIGLQEIYRIFQGVLKTSKISLISKENPFEDYYVLEFQKPAGLIWRPGEHGIFSIKDRGIQGKKWRAFSITSVYQDGIIGIATRTGETPSNFKKALISLKPNDKIDLRGPFGWFTLQNESDPVIMIAGGVGIAPFISLSREISKEKICKPVEIIYSSHSKYLFEKELNDFVFEKPHRNLHLTVNRVETREILLKTIKTYGNKGFYYVSGVPEMISETKKILKENGIKGNRIFSDPFYGY